MHEKGTKLGALSLLVFAMVLARLSRINELGVWSKSVAQAHVQLWPDLIQISGYATTLLLAFVGTGLNLLAVDR